MEPRSLFSSVGSSVAEYRVAAYRHSGRTAGASPAGKLDHHMLDLGARLDHIHRLVFALTLEASVRPLRHEHGSWRYAYFSDPDDNYVCLSEARY